MNEAYRSEWLREMMKEYETLGFERKLQKLTDLTRTVEQAPRDMPRNRDDVKGKVRLRWNHHPSTNVSKYRIDRIAERTLVVTNVEPNPIHLTREELWRKL